MKLFNRHLAISFLLTILFSGCTTYKKVYLYSPDESQSITTILDGDTVYIIDGTHNKIPQNGYVKLDWSNRDLAETLNVCWKNKGEKYEWYVVLKNALIIENLLDTSLYKFSTTLPTDIYGLPTEIKFRSINCSTVNLIECKNSPSSNTIVKCKN